MPSRTGLAALSALFLSSCHAGLPPPDPRLARHLAEVDGALAASPADLGAARRDAEAAAAISLARAGWGSMPATVAESVAACRDAVVALADRGVTDPLLIDLSAARATCRLAANSDALLGKDPHHARN